MRNIYILLFLSSIYSPLFANDNSTILENILQSENDSSEKSYENIQLVNSPLKDDEKINKNTTPRLTQFISYISPKEMASNKVLFYNLDQINTEFLPRLIHYLLNDKDALKLHSIKNNIAIMVTNDFDINLFEQNAKNISILITPISQTEFLND